MFRRQREKENFTLSASWIKFKINGGAKSGQAVKDTRDARKWEQKKKGYDVEDYKKAVKNISEKKTNKSKKFKKRVKSEDYRA